MINAIKAWLWKFRKKKIVIVNFVDHDDSIEGILMGVWAGHYVLRTSKLIKSAEESYKLDGETLIPMSRVLFMQCLASDAS